MRLPAFSDLRFDGSSENFRALIVSVVLFVVLIGGWELSQRADEIAMLGGEPDEYAQMTAGSTGSNIPIPSEIAAFAWQELTDPFYDFGEANRGIGLQVAYSLTRVLIGFSIAAAVAIPIGFLIGMSPVMRKALNPYIQVLRPISPLAWMPLALYIIRDSDASSVFVIFICSLWPMLLNTAFGVAAVSRDWLNIARTHELGALRTAFQVVLPAAAPTIVTGMRISMGIAWLVIVAAEMLIGGTGIGYYVWQQWNNLDLTAVIFAILVIGVVGMFLDQIFARTARAVAYE